MLFIQEIGSDIWWEYDRYSNRLYNYYGGYHEAASDTKEWQYIKRIEAPSWHALYLKTGYCCLERGLDRNIWLSPEGTAYPCESHTVTASAIVDVIYGISDMTFPDDYLISKGWVKITTSEMLDYYISQGYYKNLTKAQIKTIREWCSYYKIAPDLIINTPASR